MGRGKGLDAVSILYGKLQAGKTAQSPPRDSTNKIERYYMAKVANTFLDDCLLSIDESKDWAAPTYNSEAEMIGYTQCDPFVVVDNLRKATEWIEDASMNKRELMELMNDFVQELESSGSVSAQESLPVIRSLATFSFLHFHSFSLIYRLEADFPFS